MGDFADELSRCRIVAGLSQNQLAQRAGIDKAMVSRLERRERHPSRETIGKLADALGLDDGTDEDRQMRVALYLSAGYVPGGWIVTGLERAA